MKPYLYPILHLGLCSCRSLHPDSFVIFKTLLRLGSPSVQHRLNILLEIIENYEKNMYPNKRYELNRIQPTIF